MKDRIFCKIVKQEIPSNILYEDDSVIAINDLNPQAEAHVLVIPKTHVASLAELEDEKLMSAILKGVKATAKKLGLTDYRTIINSLSTRISAPFSEAFTPGRQAEKSSFTGLTIRM